MSVPAGTSASNVANRASVVPAGTLTVNFAVCAVGCGSVTGNAAPLGLDSVAWLTTAGSRPATEVDSVPLKPGFTVRVAEPAVPVPSTWAGALIATGRSAIWLCTLCVPSCQSSEPKAYWPNGAVVRVNVTWYCLFQPAPRYRLLGVTVTSKPGGAVMAGR